MDVGVDVVVAEVKEEARGLEEKAEILPLRRTIEEEHEHNSAMPNVEWQEFLRVAPVIVFVVAGVFS